MSKTSLKLVLSYGALLLIVVLLFSWPSHRYRAATPQETAQYERQDSAKFQQIRSDLDTVPADTLHLVK